MTNAIYVIYKVSDWRKYWFNDPNAVLIANGLNHWEARRRMRELNKNDFNGPRHPDGQPIGRFKICTQDNWDKDRKQLQKQQIELF